jgi:hypothetical protein
MLRAVVAHCEQESTTVKKEKEAREDESYKLLKKMLEALKSLLADMLKLMELVEEKNISENQEIPANVVDPKKVHFFCYDDKYESFNDATFHYRFNNWSKWAFRMMMLWKRFFKTLLWRKQRNTWSA